MNCFQTGVHFHQDIFSGHLLRHLHHLHIDIRIRDSLGIYADSTSGYLQQHIEFTLH